MKDLYDRWATVEKDGIKIRCPYCQALDDWNPEDDYYPGYDLVHHEGKCFTLECPKCKRAYNAYWVLPAPVFIGIPLDDERD